MSGEQSHGSVVQVAVGVMLDAVGRVLVARRRPEAHQGGLWEFPGGKIEAGEDLLAALRRELHEELGIRVEEARHWFTQEHRYPDKSVALQICLVRRFSGEPRGLEGQPLRWASVAELMALSFPAANLPIVAALQTLSAELPHGPA